MAVFSFRGFANGTPVAISATQGTSSDSGSVTAWAVPDSSPITLSLSANRTSGTGTVGILFSAEGTSPAARVQSGYHDIEYVWDFDDPGSYDNGLRNDPLWPTDRNIGYGPRTAHVFSEPGTYTVSCTAHDGENPPKTETLTVIVADADAVFAGAQTAVVSTAGNFAGAPSGASQHTSIAAALSALSSQTNRRLLLRYGETYTETADFGSASGGSNRSAMIGAFGTPADGLPFIDKTASTDDAIEFNLPSANWDEIAVRDIRIEGSYDPTATSQNSSPDGNGITFSFGCTQVHKTVWGCDIQDVGNNSISCFQSDTGNPQILLYVGDTYCEGWRNYGILGGDAGNWGFCGSSLRQRTGTQNGPSKSGGAPFWPDHGPFRMSRPQGMVVFANCDLVSLNDWSASSSSQSYQPPWRWQSGDFPDQELVIDRCRAEGGVFTIYNNAGGSPGVTDNFVLVDRLHYICADHTSKPVVLPMGGCHVRNSVFVIPDAPPSVGTGVQNFFDDSNQGQGYFSGGGTRRSEFYSNALIDLRSDANARSRTGNQDRDADFTLYENLSNVYAGNNITHAPNMNTGGETGQAPLDDTTQWNVARDAERWEGGAPDFSRGYGNASTASFAPLSGSAAIGGASGKVSVLDFYGTLRADVLGGLSRSSASEGPFEPNIES